ncbi:MAG: oxidoreductase [Planctomycetes bacterium]|nr:oxidoreductase [Planctomycetota bacterium]
MAEATPAGSPPPVPAPSPAAAAAAPIAPPPEPVRRKIKEVEAMVADAIAETDDTTTLVLFTGNDTLEYKPGHFLTIDPHQFAALDRWLRFLEDQKGKRESPRAYSLASAPHEKYLAITVKEEYYVSGQTKYPPLLSPTLVKRTPRGTKMTITGFTGAYFLPPDIESHTDHLVHICAGSGMVPNWSIIKHAFATGLKLRHTVIYSNKTWDDIIYRRDLDDLQRKYPEQLRVVHTLTRDSVGIRASQGVRHGRISLELLKEVVPDPSAVRVYTCGPAIGVWDRQAAKAKGEQPAPRFLEAVLGCLEQLGVQKQQIRHESYG